MGLLDTLFQALAPPDAVSLSRAGTLVDFGGQIAESPLNLRKILMKFGVVLADAHTQALRFGPSFDVLDDMPGIEEGAPVGSAMDADYDQNFIEFPGEWTTDMRLCLQAQSPRPVMVMSATIVAKVY